MMKKTTQTLLLIVSTLLLLVSLTVSAHAQAGDFSGNWNIVTDKGKTLLFRLEQGPRGVTGSYPVNGLTASYQPSDGSIYGIVKVSASTAQPAPQNLGLIRGSVRDNVMRFTWRQDNAQGTGRLTLSSDGESLEGTFSAPSNPDDTSGGTLSGTRVYSFAGAWRGRLGEGGFELVLQQAGAYRVTGQLNLNSAIYDIKDGRVDAKTLSFTIVRAGRSLPNGAMSPNEVLGRGELTMERGGKSFTGNILGTPVTGTLVGLVGNNKKRRTSRVGCQDLTRTDWNQSHGFLPADLSLGFERLRWGRVWIAASAGTCCHENEQQKGAEN